MSVPLVTGCPAITRPAVQPLELPTHPEHWLLRHVVFTGKRGVDEPGVIVASWPGEHLPVARIRVLANACLYDLELGQFDLMGE